MCGIAGIMRSDPAEPIDRAVLVAMAGAIRHRGPDSDGFLERPGVGLAHTRLAIQDLSPRGAQPMKGEGRVWIVFNGEFYDFRERRRELEAHGRIFVSDCDTEVILALYEERGLDFVQAISGQFAIAIWDEPRRRLVLARDRIGKKPLYWHHGPRGLAFASELGALTACPDVPRTIDPRALLDFLTYLYVPDPRSIYEGVSKLPPGHLAVWHPGEPAPSPRRYFTLDDTILPGRALEDTARELRSLVERAVRRRLVADVPLGAFLSGGVDSSTVVGVMAGVRPDPVRTASIGFDEDDFSELPFAREVARRFGTDHVEETVRPGASEAMPTLVQHLGEPFSDASALPTFYLSRLARRRVTVALSGDGGDELFSGYRKYAICQKEAALRERLPHGLARRLGALGHRWPADSRIPRLLRAPRVLRYLADDDAHMVFRHNDTLGEELRALLPTPGFREALGDHDPFTVTERPYREAEARGQGPLGRWLAVDLATYLPGDILVKVDRMAMAHSLEVRSPLLDEDVLAFAARLPESHRLEGGVGKRVLKRAAADLLPDAIVNRRKQGFGIPLDAWFRGGLRDWGSELLLSRRAVERGILDPGTVSALWEEHLSGRRDRGAVLWSLALLELWFREVHERDRPRESARPTKEVVAP
jgi:asparagine synthase (glutamine-hydrolysing)